MKKEFLEKNKERLKKEKEELEKTLANFAKRDKKIKENWKARMPKMAEGRLEEEADEIEEYSALVPIEGSLELELQKINLALKKIKSNKYGICEKCKKPISLIRLKVYPQARYCKKCQK